MLGGQSHSAKPPTRHEWSGKLHREVARLCTVISGFGVTMLTTQASAYPTQIEHSNERIPRDPRLNPLCQSRWRHPTTV
jgi:hypothetical protein